MCYFLSQDFEVYQHVHLVIYEIQDNDYGGR
jgi:hypothetical protein